MAALQAIRTYHDSLEGLAGPVAGTPEEQEDLQERVDAFFAELRKTNVSQP